MKAATMVLNMLDYAIVYIPRSLVPRPLPTRGEGPGDEANIPSFFKDII